MRHALVLMIAGLLSTAAAGREAGDATARRIPVPDRATRVVAAAPAAAVVLYVLSPDLMVARRGPMRANSSVPPPAICPSSAA
jgi:hypothetical protein